MARMSLPPGFRFHPTDVELVMYYLKRQLMGKKLSYEAITELNIYKYCPWDLPDKSCMRSKDLEWFFFCPREKKYASGTRANRATESGFWKTTGKDRAVNYKERTVGMIKTLIFHCGHAPRGERTDWVMHEYRMVDTDLADAGVPQDAYVLCKVFQKSGPGPKNGAQYGAPFNEEDWDDDAAIAAESSAVDDLTLAAIVPSNNPNSSALTSMMVPYSEPSCSLTEPGPSTAGPVANETLLALSGDDDIVSLLGMFTEDSSFPTGNENEEHNNRVIDAVPCSGGNDIYSGLGDLGNCVYLTEDGFNMSSIFEAGYAQNPMFQTADTSFLELSDLETPLEIPEAQLEQFAPHMPPTPYNSGENLGDVVYGGNSLGTAQHLSPLNQPTAPLEGSYWQGNNITNMLQQENGIVGIASQGYSSAFNYPDLASTRQPEASRNITAQAIRGEQQRIPYSGRLQQLLESIPAHPASAVLSSKASEISSDDEDSDSLSIHGSSGSSYFDVKAEVTPRGGDGGWCTKDALSWGSICRCRRVSSLGVAFSLSLINGLLQLYFGSLVLYSSLINLERNNVSVRFKLKNASIFFIYLPIHVDILLVLFGPSRVVH